jgi:hypothetical protein
MSLSLTLEDMLMFSTLEMNMKLLKIAVLCSLILVANSCTVLGFATDMAVLSVLHDADNVDINNEELFFTIEGLEQDAKLITTLVTQLLISKEGFNPLFEKKSLSTTLTCENVVDGKQQCFPPEYYKGMYIEYSASKVDEIKSPKD